MTAPIGLSDPSGMIYLQIGVASQGQSHETTLAQVCAAELGVDTERIVVVGGDTAVLGYGNDTIASRVAAVAGPAVARTSRAVARKARLVAGEAARVRADGRRETGVVRLLRYAAVHDCGRPLNPMIVEGQLHGGIVQGIGAALAEELIYDGQGQLVTGSWLEYGLPTAEQVPPLDVVAVDFPSTRNEMGIKGVGESGVISPVPAIANAVEDALADRDVAIERVPLTAASVWEALRKAGPSTLPRPGRV